LEFRIFSRFYVISKHETLSIGDPSIIKVLLQSKIFSLSSSKLSLSSIGPIIRLTFQFPSTSLIIILLLGILRFYYRLIWTPSPFLGFAGHSFNYLYYSSKSIGSTSKCYPSIFLSSSWLSLWSNYVLFTIMIGYCTCLSNSAYLDWKLSWFWPPSWDNVVSSILGSISLYILHNVQTQAHTNSSYENLDIPLSHLMLLASSPCIGMNTPST